MRATLITLAVLGALLVVYITSFHLLVASGGSTEIAVEGTPGHLVRTVTRQALIARTRFPSRTENLAAALYRPLEQLEYALSRRALSADDPGVHEIQDVLDAVALDLRSGADEDPGWIAVDRLHAAVAAAIPGDFRHQPPPTAIHASPTNGHAWLIRLDWPGRQRIYAHGFGSVVDMQHTH